MALSTLDWLLIISFFVISLLVGVLVYRKSSKNVDSFFLSGRNMPWWLLGVSMVATTFAADTPGLVAGIVRKDGVYGNWIWWSFLLTGMLTVFFYAKLWRRSNITTDLEFYEIRYSGRSAALLRGFRALYLGVFFNVVIMATVCLAAIKIGHVLFGFSEVQTLVIASLVTVFYSLLGGLRGVLITDFIQFIIAMVGSVWASYYIINLPQIGGLENLLTHELVQDKTAFFPDFSQPEIIIPLLIIPLSVQWWSVWYPGAEPGGGGYIAQRMLAAKDEKNAVLATLFFNVAHYALRPWPWIIIGLASLIIYPDLQSLQTAFPNLNASFVKDDLSYSAMLVFLPSGLLGIVITSLIAAFMSTISTHLNWGSSYVVNDFYARFVNKNASEKSKVRVGRISTICMMILAGLLSLILEEARDAFNLLLQIGAGTGLLFILRWFWYKINPYSEIAAMVSSFLIAILFFVNSKLETPWFEIASHWQLVIGVIITTIAWVSVTLLTQPSDQKTLDKFEELVFSEGKFKHINYKIGAFLLGTLGVYASLFGTGFIIYGDYLEAGISFVIALIGFLYLVKNWNKIV
ncbi:sodium:solute symporter family protein [Mesonia sp. MT50]|uniref:Sodium:solute symporter family protein n=1 Tax=Mesonia profundi TaxID=3070998 RepID=A0ABU1A0Q3_9FLAO|nr:sodium:solute symporter family protein [Mesonia profundi]MDQ7917288.1 sodium:solute symporter family protein [Mesonia profundi]